jgi:peptide/nickel transport system substrate-binding protein
MTRAVARSLLLLVTPIALLACGPREASPSATQPGPSSSPSRTLVIAVRAEPNNLALKALSSGVGTSFATTQRVFNATLGFIDGQGVTRPYLAEALPQLNTDTWRLFPDGTMETTYRLKANLSWQDGTPLTAEDFVFAWQVYTAPQVGIGSGAPQNLMAEVTAPDARTISIGWKKRYPDAGTLSVDEFPPLPRHLLQAPFQRDPEGLATQPFWTRDYVGLGPFRLARWEPGAFIEGTAFEGHTLGMPRIGRIRIIFVPDTNTALAGLLAGDVQFATDSVIRFEQGLVLQREWGPRRGGAVLAKTGGYRAAWAQLRPDLADPKAVLDLRVRKALAFSINRQDINEALFEGQGIMTEGPFIPPSTSYFAEIDRAIPKYPYDLRTAEQLMAEAGFRKGSDGVFASVGEGPVQFGVRTLSDTQREKEMAVLADGWRQAGFDFSESTLRSSQAADNEARATFPSLFTYSTGSGEYSLAAFTAASIGRPENRWIGPNRSAWANQEFDRFSSSFTDAVEPAERVRFIVQMASLMNAELPGIPLLFDSATDAHIAALRGPQPVAQEAQNAWNIHEWELDA